eukprot:9466029-Pyramimonas_sp.AAC.1
MVKNQPICSYHQQWQQAYDQGCNRRNRFPSFGAIVLLLIGCVTSNPMYDAPGLFWRRRRWSLRAKNGASFVLRTGASG